MRFNGDINKIIYSYGLCGGSCYDLAGELSDKNIDLFITSDVKYHEMGDSKENGLNIISIDHFHEKEVLPILKEKLEKWLLKDGFNTEISMFESEESYFKYI